MNTRTFFLVAFVGLGTLTAINHYHDAPMMALVGALCALGAMSYRHIKLAPFRQMTIIALSAWAGCVVPALIEDPAFYGPIMGSSAFLALAGAYRLGRPISREVK